MGVIKLLTNFPCHGLFITRYEEIKNRTCFNPEKVSPCWDSNPSMACSEADDLPTKPQPRGHSQYVTALTNLVVKGFQGGVLDGSKSIVSFVLKMV